MHRGVAYPAQFEHNPALYRALSDIVEAYRRKEFRKRLLLFDVVARAWLAVFVQLIITEQGFADI